MAITLSDKTDEQIEKEMKEKGLIPKNTICDFEVLDEVTFGTKTIVTEDATSKAGNDMIVLVLRVFYGEDERGKVLIDYITGAMEFKLRHAMASCGVTNNPVSAKDFIGKCGKVKIGIQKSKDEQYSDKNVVLDYIVKPDVTVELDDEIPSF